MLGQDMDVSNTGYAYPMPTFVL